MKYRDNLNYIDQFYAWQPSTWPSPPKTYNDKFGKVLKKIFNDSLFSEIENVIRDAPTLEHRGHIIALSILCAIDALSSYAFYGDRVGPRYKKYIHEFFPLDYRRFAEKIYELNRNSIVHSWNLFEVGMLPGSEPIMEVNGTIVVGLLNFFDALKQSINNFLDKLEKNSDVQRCCLLRYGKLTQKTRP